MRRSLIAVGLVGSVVALLTAPAAGAEWRFEALDGAGGPNGRTTNNVGAYDAVLLFGGKPHVWYHDATGGDLRHAWWNGTAWSFETLDGNGGPNGRTTNTVGLTNAALLYQGAPHVWTYDQTLGDLRHAWYG